MGVGQDLSRRDADDFCRRRSAVHRRERDIAALRLFLDHLEAEHVIRAAPSVIDRSPLGRLKAVRGLPPARPGALAVTVTRHWFVLRRFLLERFGDGPIDCGRCGRRRHPLPAPPFPAQSRCAPTCQAPLLPSFPVASGDTDRDLTAAIPPVRRWRLVDVPKYLAATEVEHVLASAIARRRSAGATTPSCCCWRDWVCVPVKSSGWSSTTSTGARAS